MLSAKSTPAQPESDAVAAAMLVHKGDAQDGKLGGKQRLKMSKKHAPTALTAEQALVAETDVPCTLVSACPGAGKSTTLCARADRLVRTRSVAPQDVLLLTFSVRARKDLQDKLQTIGRADCRVFTFHALALRLLDATSAGQQTRLLTGRELTEAMRDVASTCGRPDGSVARADDDEVRSLLQILDLRKSGAPTERATQWALKCLDAFEATKAASRGVRDYADLILDATQLLAKVAPHERFALVQRVLGCRAGVHLMIDEVQDVSRAQLLFCEALLPVAKSLVAVGDLNQSIYAWRGAHAHPFDFMTTCVAPVPVRHLRLTRGFRCPRELVVAANAVLRAFAGGNIDANSSLAGCAVGAIRVVQASSSDERAQHRDLAVRLRALQRTQDGASLVVLCRLQKQVVAVKLVLSTEYRMDVRGGALDAPTREQLRPLLAFLRLALAPEQADGAFWTVLNVPPRGLGQVAERYLRTAQANVNELAAKRGGSPLPAIKVGEMLLRRDCPKFIAPKIAAGGGASASSTIGEVLSINAPAQKGLRDLCATLRELEAAVELGPNRVVEKLLAAWDFDAHFAKLQMQAAVTRTPAAQTQQWASAEAFGGGGPRAGGAHSSTPTPALALLRRLAQEYAAHSADAAEARNSLARMIEDLELADTAGETDVFSAGAVSDVAVEVCTIHAAKGREFDHVFLVGVTEGVMPLAPRPGASEQQAESAFREEARLCYGPRARTCGRSSPLARSCAMLGGRTTDSPCAPPTPVSLICTASLSGDDARAQDPYAHLRRAALSIRRRDPRTARARRDARPRGAVVFGVAGAASAAAAAVRTRDDHAAVGSCHAALNQRGPRAARAAVPPLRSCRQHARVRAHFPRYYSSKKQDIVFHPLPLNAPSTVYRTHRPVLARSSPSCHMCHANAFVSITITE
jgi:superfamily I DNA/RNA helicase